MKKHIRFILISAALFAIADQLVKSWALSRLSAGPLSIIDPWFSLQLSFNPGIAFGIRPPFVLLIIFTLIFIPTLLYLAIKELNLEKQITRLAISLILGGAIGNLIDRFTYGAVTDFIKIGPWPNFNLADIYISLGVLFMLLFYGKITRSKKQK